MWLKFKASTIKEALLLMRDKAGLAMLFIMPMALVLIMSLLQDSTLQMLQDKKTPVLLINHDADTFGLSIKRGLNRSGYFEVVETIPFDEELRKSVLEGDFLVGLIVHEGASEVLRKKIRTQIQKQFPDDEQLFDTSLLSGDKSPKIDVYFDPVTKSSFKQAFMSALREFSYAVEAHMVFDIYSGLMLEMAGLEMEQGGSFQNMVEFNDQYATKSKSRIIPNAVQHNVPAWTIFAMFFIVIPLAGNIIKERESGMSLRLKTMPGSNLAVISGKAIVYFGVGIIQAIFMLLLGVFILPMFGMPSLQFSTGVGALLLVTFSVALAASSYGILIGSVATTQEQSSIFGSISVVILAAIGGVWVPTFMMSDLMIKISKLSPLNWGLNAYYDIFLRNAVVSDVLSNVTLLLLFFIVNIGLAWSYNRYKKSLS